MSTCSEPTSTLPDACRRERRPRPHSRRRSRPAASGSRRSAADRSPPGRGAADGGVERVEDVDPRVRAGSPERSARPSRPRSQKLWTCVRRSAKTVGVVSVRLSKTLMRPLFSATKTRPSGEKRTAVGWVSPLKTISSWKPGGNDAAAAGSGVLDTTIDDAATVIVTRAPKCPIRSANAARRPCPPPSVPPIATVPPSRRRAGETFQLLSRSDV